MKKTKIFIIFTLLIALLSISCKQPISNDIPDDNTESITPGWYLYTTNADSSYPQKTYLYINTSGSIERAGSTDNEYTGTQLELLQGQLSYSVCKKNADGTMITFEATEAPSWGIAENTNDNSEETCPYEEGDYLDVTKYSSFSWPVNKNLPLWSENAIYYWTSCNEEYGYIDSFNTFIVGSYLKAEDQIRISVCVQIDDYNTAYFDCDVTFTETMESSEEENNAGITLEAGYEWWCFEGAYLGPLDGFVLYDANGNPVRAGTSEKEVTNSLFLAMNKTQAISNFNGTKYQVTDLTKLPSWCY